MLVSRFDDDDDNDDGVATLANCLGEQSNPLEVVALLTTVPAAIHQSEPKYIFDGI